MKKIIPLIILLVLILSGCGVYTKDFKAAYEQAKQCEKAGLDFKLTIEELSSIRGVVCIINN